MTVVLSNESNRDAKHLWNLLSHYPIDRIGFGEILCCGNRSLAVFQKRTARIFGSRPLVLLLDDLPLPDLPETALLACFHGAIRPAGHLKSSHHCCITVGPCHFAGISLSSYRSDSSLISVLRSFTDQKGQEIQTGEYRLPFGNRYPPTVLCAAALILLYHGILPDQAFL